MNRKGPKGMRPRLVLAAVAMLAVWAAPAFAQDVTQLNVPAEESDVRAGPEIVATAATVDPEPFTIRQPLAPWLLWGALALAVGQAAISRGKGT